MSQYSYNNYHDYLYFLIDNFVLNYSNIKIYAIISFLNKMVWCFMTDFYVPMVT
ncbi:MULTISPECIES: hypothetical protein [Crocosphaera]|uniref:Uncharacterized protein n=1 Tax=Crocosphaera watsonii WH 0005 TaxID=423472 RepID=T2IWW4_CROWT|nr:MULTISPECIES: hypothetical protein [Crocosphaera]MCH2245571.1 hypothetical protein [Crocosphaera sp.]NQZ63852.1 hypothetical protein [Crocosphaera sp.]CCQ57354.1 hypothetical protein CWATWH0005_1334 [Crocosphaera watsonii WH 0005]